MIESFSIKEEKFVNKSIMLIWVYLLIEKSFQFLERNNIFPSIPLKKNIIYTCNN